MESIITLFEDLQYCTGAMSCMVSSEYMLDIFYVNKD